MGGGKGKVTISDRMAGKANSGVLPGSNSRAPDTEMPESAGGEGTQGLRTVFTSLWVMASGSLLYCDALLFLHVG